MPSTKTRKRKGKKVKKRASEFKNNANFEDPVVQRAHLIAVAKEVFENSITSFPHKNSQQVSGSDEGDASDATGKCGKNDNSKYDAARRNILLATNIFEPSSVLVDPLKDRKLTSEAQILPRVRDNGKPSANDVVWIPHFPMSPKKKSTQKQELKDIVAIATSEYLNSTKDEQLEIPILKLQVPSGSRSSKTSPRLARATIRRNTETRLDQYFQMYETQNDKSLDSASIVPTAACAALRTESLLWHWGDALVSMPQSYQDPDRIKANTQSPPDTIRGLPNCSAAAVFESRNDKSYDLRETNRIMLNSVPEDHKRLFGEYVSICRKSGVAPCGRLLQCMESRTGLVHAKSGELATLRLGFQSLNCTNIVSLVDLLLKVHQVSHLSGLTANLQSNCIGITGCEAIAKLVKSINVISLNLADQPPLTFGTQACIAFLKCASIHDEEDSELEQKLHENRNITESTALPSQTSQTPSAKLRKRVTGFFIPRKNSVEFPSSEVNDDDNESTKSETAKEENSTPPILLEMLDLSGNSLHDSIAPYLANFLGRCPILQQVSLARNRIGVRCCKVIANALHRTHRFSADPLTHLNLSWNQLGGKAETVLIDALQDQLCLVQLDLSFCGLSDVFATGLGAVLANNSSPTLRHINLTHNRIGPIGGYAIAEGLIRNQHLRTILLGFNPLTFDVCKTLLESFKTNRELLFLGIENAWHMLSQPVSEARFPENFGDRMNDENSSFRSRRSSTGSRPRIQSRNHLPDFQQIQLLEQEPKCNGGRDLLKALYSIYVNVMKMRQSNLETTANVIWEYPPQDLAKEFGMELIVVDQTRESSESCIMRHITKTSKGNRNDKQVVLLEGQASVFGPRIQESDSNCLYDTMSVVRLGFDADWLFLVAKLRCTLRSRKLVGNDLSLLLHRIKLVLRSHFYRLSNIAMSYAILNTEHSELISMNDFVQFVNECNLCDSTRGGSLMAMDTQVAFYSANASLFASLGKWNDRDDDMIILEDEMRTCYEEDMMQIADNPDSLDDTKNNDDEVNNTTDDDDDDDDDDAKKAAEEALLEALEAAKEERSAAEEATKLRIMAKRMTEMKDNPSNRMVRYEFLHSLVELAKFKYCRPKSITKFPIQNLDLALSLMLREHIIPNARFHTSNVWRREYLYWRDVEYVFRCHLVLLRDIWNNLTAATGRRLLPFTEWTELMHASNLLSENFTHQESAQCFYFANMLVAKEVGRNLDDRARDVRGKLSWCEFLEAIARLAETISPRSLGILTESSEMLLSQKLFYLLKTIFNATRSDDTRPMWHSYFSQGVWSTSPRCGTPRTARCGTPRTARSGTSPRDLATPRVANEEEFLASLQTMHEPLDIKETNGKFAF